MRSDLSPERHSGAIESACDAIRSFLEQRPAACDAFEGVARFWVSGVVSKDVLLAALAQLVADGELVRIIVSGQVHYTRSRTQ